MERGGEDGEECMRDGEGRMDGLPFKRKRAWE